MAVLYIAELSAGTVAATQVAALPPIAEQTVAIGGASAQSAVFNAATKLIRVHTDSICSISVGANPTAVVTNARMAANDTEYFQVKAGDRLAVIANT